MVLGRGGADAGVAEFLQAIVDRQDGHGGNLRIRREKGMSIHDRAQWNVPKIGGGVTIANHAVGQDVKRNAWGRSIHLGSFSKFSWFRPERRVLSEQRGQQHKSG